MQENLIYTDNENYWMTMVGEKIFYMTYHDDSDLDLDKVKELKENGLKLHGDKPFYSVIDLRNNFASMSKEGKEFIANDQQLNELRICEAIIVNNLAMKLIIDGYLKFHKPKSPTKVFKNKDAACKWLEENKASSNDLEQLKEFLGKQELV